MENPFTRYAELEQRLRARDEFPTAAGRRKMRNDAANAIAELRFRGNFFFGIIAFNFVLIILRMLYV